MDGTSRAKLVKAGYAIYRMRDMYPVSGGGEVRFEIREMSQRGQWVLYGTYPTKAARERAWKELAQNEMNMMETEITETTEEGMEERTQPEGKTLMEAFDGKPDIYRKAKEVAQAEFEQKLGEKIKEYEFQIFKASAGTKIKSQETQEKLSRLMRVMFLREAKEQAKQKGEWSRFCADTNIDIKNADYEIEKLGDYKDELLLSFSSFCGYDINKIKYLTSGNSEKLGVTIENGEIFVKGERVPLTPEDMQVVVNSLQEDLQKQEEKAAEEKADLEKSVKETAKELKSAKLKLSKLKKTADENGRPVEVEAFFQQMAEVRKDFDALLQRMEPEFAGALSDKFMAPFQAASEYRNTITYMKDQLAALEAVTRPE